MPCGPRCGSPWPTSPPGGQMLRATGSHCWPPSKPSWRGKVSKACPWTGSPGGRRRRGHPSTGASGTCPVSRSRCWTTGSDSSRRRFYTARRHRVRGPAAERIRAFLHAYTTCTTPKPICTRSATPNLRRRATCPGIPARTSAPGFVALRCRDRWRPGVLADVLLGPVDSELSMYPSRERGFSPERIKAWHRPGARLAAAND